ncbi:hypothetical protein BJX68DRAFT_249564 [Aspergillus pseudodeflectus]|uniref:DNA2/NAM7 helicase helicase domain-containing protein n=1 Tax=Aspergillus pseudodeflectus TaxID=176178 RepID=A0ABR4JCH2_9EURO
MVQGSCHVFDSKRQVNAVNLLTGIKAGAEFAAHWKELFLNHKRGTRRNVDPLKDIDPKHEKFNEAVNFVLKKTKLSTEQEKCIRSCTSMPDATKVILGYPGTGKTFLLAVIAFVFHRIGFHVMFSAPTNATADENCAKLESVRSILGLDSRIVRVYRPFAETQQFLSWGKKSQPGDEPKSSDDAKIDTQVEAGDQPKSTGDAKPDDTPDDAPDTAEAIPLDTQLHMLFLTAKASAAQRERTYGRPESSLEVQVVQEALNAEKENRVLMGRYPSEDQISLSHGKIQFDEIENFKGPEVDFFQALREYLKTLEEAPLSEWEDGEKPKALLAFKMVGDYVMKQAPFLVSTNNNLACAICSGHFAKEAKGVLLIRDEDSKEVESNGLIPLVSCGFSPKVVAQILCDDTRQLKPTVLTAGGEPGWNEFSHQLETSGVVRLIKGNHPVEKLTMQRRFRPQFVGFLNKRVYNGGMKSHPSTKQILVNAAWASMIRAQFPEALSTLTLAIGF